MKKSILITVLFAVSTLLFAKENKKADSYKTHEVVSTGLTTAKDNVPVVYFIRDITPEALVKVYNATGYKAQGKTGVKVSTGEGDDSNYLRPALIKNLVKDELNAIIVECNTAYGGNRSNNINHMKIAKDHGFLESMAEAAKSVCDYMQNGIHTLDHAEKIGFGNRNYRLVEIK